MIVTCKGRVFSNKRLSCDEAYDHAFNVRVRNKTDFHAVLSRLLRLLLDTNFVQTRLIVTPRYFPLNLNFPFKENRL